MKFLKCKGSIEPLLPKPVKRADEKADHEWIIVPSSMASFESCELVRLGTICPIGIRRTKLATDGSKNGFEQAPLRPYSRNWYKM